MSKSEWIKSIDQLLEWGKNILEEDDVEYGELINVFGEFDSWSAESSEDEHRIEKEMKPIAEKMVKEIKQHSPDYFPSCKWALKSYTEDVVVAEKVPIRWYWTIFED